MIFRPHPPRLGSQAGLTLLLLPLFLCGDLKAQNAFNWDLPPQQSEDSLPSVAAREPFQVPGEIIAKPDLAVQLKASMWGKIYLEDGVYPGARVEKDQPLARTVLELPANERLPLNDRTIDIQQALEVAKEKARVALEDYRRAEAIAKKNSSFQEEAERRKKIYTNSMKELQIVNSQHQRQDGVIVRRDPRTVELSAPISGYVDEILFVPGEINPDGSFRELMTIIDLSTVWVHADVYEKDLASFRHSPDAVVTADAYPGETFPARFQSIGAAIDPENRTIPVYYEVPNPGEKLKIGLRVRLKLQSLP